MPQSEGVSPLGRSEIARSGGSSGDTSKVYKAFTNKKVNVVLDEYNFLVWKQQVLLAVRSLRLEKLLTGALKAPPATVVTTDGASVENEDYEIFVAQDSALASWLLSTISASLLPQFVGAETTADIWSTVLRFFTSRSTTTIMSLHYKLRSLKKGDLSMRAYVSQVKEICNALASSGSLISDLEIIATILNGLTIEYQPFVAIITASRDPFTLDAAISVLLDAETQLSNFNPLSDVSSSLNVVQASAANLDIGKEADSSTNMPYRQSSRGRGRFGRMRLQCQLCGKLGHLVDRCWHRFDENFVPITARSKDTSHTDAKSVHVSTADLGSQTCSCHYTGGVASATGTEDQGAVQPQVNLLTAADQWFVDSGASHHVTPDPSCSQGGSAYLGPGNPVVTPNEELSIAGGGSSPVMSTSLEVRQEEGEFGGHNGSSNSSPVHAAVGDVFDHDNEPEQGVASVESPIRQPLLNNSSPQAPLDMNERSGDRQTLLGTELIDSELVGSEVQQIPAVENDRPCQTTVVGQVASENLVSQVVQEVSSNYMLMYK
ncbi:hypothetical protein GQ457_10G024220 [Hibiscus cannabinus]